MYGFLEKEVAELLEITGEEKHQKSTNIDTKCARRFKPFRLNRKAFNVNRILDIKQVK